MREQSLAAAAIGIALTLGTARAQTVNVWPGVAPGSERWTQKEVTIENTPLGTVILNVVTPTLTAYLPERGKATGTGIILAPGGAFVALAIDLEANSIARIIRTGSSRKRTSGSPMTRSRCAFMSSSLHV